MDKLKVTSHEMRRARTRSLVQLGGLVSKSGLLETFEISLGQDLQRDPEQKHQVAALFKGLVELNEMAQSDDVSLQLWAYQGLNLLGDGKDKTIQIC
jgi:hypothetical protein